MMKRIILYIVVLLVSLVAYSQPRLVVPEISYGFHGGVMAGIVHFSPEVEQEVKSPLWGGNGGFVFRYGNTKYTSLQIELNYMQRGWNQSDTLYSRRLDFIEIPLLMHLYVGQKVRGFLNLGPQIGFCVGQKSRGSSGMSGHQYEPIDNRFDWGLAGGLGLQVNSRKAGSYFIEARFNYSFADLYANHKSDYFDASNAMNLSLNLGWLWNKK